MLLFFYSRSRGAFFSETKKKDELEKYFAADPSESERFELIQTLTVKLLE